jgi:hypothetical protein
VIWAVQVIFWGEKMKKKILKFLNLEIIGVDTICRLIRTWKSNAKIYITEVGVKLWSGFYLA